MVPSRLSPEYSPSGLLLCAGGGFSLRRGDPAPAATYFQYASPQLRPAPRDLPALASLATASGEYSGLGVAALAIPLAVGLGVSCIALARLAGSPIDPYGELGAEWIEHGERVRVLHAWGLHRGLLSFARAADGAYPPLLHVLTLPAGALAGHGAEDVAWTGVVWLWVLAAGLAMAAWGLVPGRPAAPAAAAVGAFLLPVAHGASVRYYYDLPMTALLWASAGLLLALQGRRPLLAGGLAGLMAGLACLAKWSALPLAIPMLAGAVASVRPCGRYRRAVLVLALAVGLALPTAGFLAVSTRSFTEMMTAFGPEDAPAAQVGAAARRVLRQDPGLQAPDRSDRSGGRAERLGWYARGLVRSVWAPLGVAVMLPLAVAWALRRGPGGWLLGSTFSCHLAFAVAVLPPLDERFVLPLAPALPLAAALGWSRLGGVRWRAGTCAVAIASGMWIAADFHLGHDPLLDPRTTVGQPEPGAGLGLASSWERRGWGRADRSRPARLAFREALWGAAERTHPERVGIVGGPLVDPFGDTNWWRYRALLASVRRGTGGQGAIEVVDLCGSGDPAVVDLVIAADTRVAPIVSPWCHAAGNWSSGYRIPDPERRVGAVVWEPATKGAPTPGTSH